MGEKHTNLYWLQAGGCGGDTISLLGLDTSLLTDFLRLAKVNVLWHPSLSNISADEHKKLLDRIIDDKEILDILVVEGAVLRGPGGTGMYETMFGKPKKDYIAAIAAKAKWVVAAGTCASFGGIPADGIAEATGLQFHKDKKGGFLGASFTTWAGNPVINLPGCPCHPEVVAGALSCLLADTAPVINEFNAPLDWYGALVHQGCTRNEYHEYRVEEKSFGEKGCLFFHMGCHGPLTYAPCNKLLWNQHNSKPRCGVPCFGCARPDFPRPAPFYATENIEEVPVSLPEGIKRPHYLAYKSMAAAAAPDRLKKRVTKV